MELRLQDNNTQKSELPDRVKRIKQTWDSSSDQRFYDYYAKESQEEQTYQRFSSIRNRVMSIFRKRNFPDNALHVADIGCGAGTQSIMWAEEGHTVYGLDVNKPLLELGRQRADKDKNDYSILFLLGTATNLPLANESVHVCLVPELLEHVAQWQICLDEFSRVLKKNGILFLSTTNKLCPNQNEFNLPFYSWYPRRLKRHYEKLAYTTRPQIANFAKYPAVNWFSFYSLRDELRSKGFVSMDRFDVTDLAGKGRIGNLLIAAVRSVPMIRWLAHVSTPYTAIFAIKQ